jgi:hypothetical protein
MATKGWHGSNRGHPASGRFLKAARSVSGLTFGAPAGQSASRGLEFPMMNWTAATVREISRAHYLVYKRPQDGRRCWCAPKSIDSFGRYLERLASILWQLEGGGGGD